HAIVRQPEAIAQTPHASPMKLPMLSTDEKLAEIRRLYFSTTRQTIDRDLSKALDLLKSMQTEEERERATVYMHGLNEMRAEWAGKGKREKAKGKRQKAKGRR